MFFVVADPLVKRIIRISNLNIGANQGNLDTWDLRTRNLIVALQAR
jgi:hypothetical protein